MSYAVYNDNALYRLKLLSDQEILNNAVSIYDSMHLSNNDSTLDSPIFGATHDSECSICHNTGWSCPGHYAVIELPFAIPKFICIDDWRKIITCICPICSHIPIADVNSILLQPVRDRLMIIKNKITNATKHNKDGSMICAFCGHKIVPLKIDPKDSLTVTSTNAELTGFNGRVNPNLIKNMLQNFVQVDELGFCETYHPKNFMTNYIPIVTTKLRTKSTANSESTLTSYYKTIIEEIIPELTSIAALIGPNSSVIETLGSKLIMFNKAYNKLYAYYSMITSPVPEELKNNYLTLMNKRDRKHYDPSNPLAGRLKGKDKSIFAQGIIYSRVNKSARTVLGGAVDVPFRNICIPNHICQILTTNYKVYTENVNKIRTIIAGMATKTISSSETIPKVLQIIKSSGIRKPKVIKITPENAIAASMKLLPGDEVTMTLIDTDFAIMSRFPIVREESATALEIASNANSIITIPLPICNMKMADFDGDEAQTYCLTNHNTDAESILLYSTFSQFIAYKDGAPAIWFNADAPTGLLMVKPGNKIRIHNSKPINKELNIVDIIESYLPKDLCYIDGKTEIINGKFRNNKLKIDNKEFFKYMYQLYGPDIVADFMHNVTILSYDICKDYGITLGFDIKIYGGKETINKIQKIKDETYQKMCEIERTNDPLKSFRIVQQTQLQKPKILEVLMPPAQNSNLKELGFLASRQDEYYQNVVQIDHVVIDGDRITETLVDGTRTTCNAPRFSISPEDYGFCMDSYNSDISPIAHFFECKQQRFAIFQKGAAVAKQGYLTKKLSVAFSKIYTDYNGAIVDNYRILAPQYGAAGLNPRLYVEQPLVDMFMDNKEFDKKYKSDKRLQFLHKEFNNIYDIYKNVTNFIKDDIIKNKFAAGFNYDIYIDTHKESDKPTKQEDIDKYIERLFNNFSTQYNRKLVENNFKQHEYFFRQKLSTCTLSDKELDKVYDIFSWTLQDGGEAIGGKAAIACSEPLTQNVLHAIHHAGGSGANIEKIIRSTGTSRFEELLAQPKAKDEPSVITIKLYDDSKESCNNFVCQNETIMFSNVWKECYLAISNNLPEFIKHIHPNIDFSKVSVNEYHIIMSLDMSEVAAFNISVADIAFTLSSKIDIVEFITGYKINSKIFMMYIFFKPGFSYERISDWSLRLTQTKDFIIHGSCIRNCFISENKNMKGHYIIECNDIPGTDAFNQILHLPGVDPSSCRCNDMRECATILGVCETNTRHYEELIYTAAKLSATTGILQRHYKVLADCIYAGGDAIYADRNSFKYDRFTDTLRYVQFETATNMIKSSIKNGDINPVADPFAAAVFNDQPSLGSGASKFNIYQDNI